MTTMDSGNSNVGRDSSVVGRGQSSTVNKNTLDSPALAFMPWVAVNLWPGTLIMGSSISSWAALPSRLAKLLRLLRRPKPLRWKASLKCWTRHPSLKLKAPKTWNCKIGTHFCFHYSHFRDQSVVNISSTLLLSPVNSCSISYEIVKYWFLNCLND